MTVFKIGDLVRCTAKYNSVWCDADMVVDEVYNSGAIGVDHPVRGAGAFEPYMLHKITSEVTKPTLAATIGLEPQTRRILGHLEKRGSISPMEALSAYGCLRLAAQVFKLRKAGFDVLTDLREDEAGHRYARYSLAKEAPRLMAA